MELCFALTSAASSKQVETAAYLLLKVPLNILFTFSAKITKTATERGHGSLDGVAFLHFSIFLGSPESTYAVVEKLIADEDEVIVPELAAYMKSNWSLASFYEGTIVTDDHYVNVMRVLRRGCSEI